LSANYLACVSRTKELSIFDINTLQLFAGPINIPEHLSKEENQGLNDIWLKIWLPGASSASGELKSLKTQKFFFIVTGLYFTFIWDVESLKRVSSPKVIKELSSEPIYFAKHVHRGYTSDIFIEFVDDWHGTQVKFVRLIWDSRRQKISAQNVLALKNSRPDEMRSYELRDFYAENTKIMLLFKYSEKLYVTEVDVPKKSDDFIEFDIDDEEHCKLVFENADKEFISTAKIQNSDVIIAHNGYSFRVVVRKKSTNQGGYELTEYYLLCRQKFSSIVAIEYKFNNLFIFDATGSSEVYKLENASSFQRINFSTDRVTQIKNKKFFMDPNIKLVLKNGAPCLALVSTRIILFAKL
ncbi:GSCOCG00008644001-RA-CDS, partial [Cotesia congregata]